MRALRMAMLAVTLAHWGFAILGGVAGLAFTELPSPAKPFVPLLVVVPQLAWTLFVVRRARMARLGAWG